MRGKFIEKAGKIGVFLSAEQAEKFTRFFFLLTETNKKFNLTAITGEDEVVDKHFIDSLSGAKYFTGKIRAADVGSGAGFPAIPLAIVCPEADFTLIDSLNKRVNFLNSAARELDLPNVTARHARAEDLAAGGDREGFSVVTARAVAPLPTLLEYCLPLVKVGGLFLGYKTPNEDFTRAEKAAQVLGGGGIITEEFTLPGTDIRRVLVKVEKITATPRAYPRAKNAAKVRPL